MGDSPSGDAARADVPLSPKVATSSSEPTKAWPRDLRFWLQLLVIPATGWIVTTVYQASETERALLDKRVTLYTELLSRREQADTEVRRAIFDKVVEKYLQPESGIDNKMVALDLMSANFHDSLDLSPLFWQLDRIVSKDPDKKVGGARLEELARMAGEVKTRQLEALRVTGASQEISFDLAKQVDGAIVASEEFDLEFSDPTRRDNDKETPFKRHFAVDVIEPDLSARRLLLQIRHWKLEKKADQKVLFLWADLYDFPLVTFTRVSSDERIAVVLRQIPKDLGFAKVAILYYPSSRGGVKDKPFIDEVIQNLVTQPVQHRWWEVWKWEIWESWR